MWRDSDGGVHTVWVADPEMLFPGWMVARIERAAVNEIVSGKRVLSSLFNQTLDSARLLEMGDDEDAYEEEAPPSISLECEGADGVPLGELLRNVVSDQSPRWGLDYLESLMDLLDTRGSLKRVVLRFEDHVSRLINDGDFPEGRSEQVEDLWVAARVLWDSIETWSADPDPAQIRRVEALPSERLELGRIGDDLWRVVESIVQRSGDLGGKP